MNMSSEKLLRKIYEEVFKKVYTRSSVKKLSTGDKTEILNIVKILNSSDKYKEFSKKYAILLSKKGITYKKGMWRKYFKIAKKKGYIALSKTWSEFEEEQLRKTIVKNFEMIKTIPQKTLEVMERKYTGALIEEVVKGNLPRDSFYKQLQVHGHKNAKVIARTESAKIQASITENRAKDLGSIAYIWVSTKDKRTRPSHKNMNEVIVFWRDNLSERPLLDKMNGNPGEFPNCRCSAEPIFDEDDIPNKSSLTYYDYKTHKQKNIKRKDLIELLQKGGEL